MKSLYFFLLCIFFSTQSFPLNSAEQKLIIVRHGEATNNIENVYNSNPSSPNYKVVNLTEKGKQTVQETAKKLLAQGFNNGNIVAVFESPLPRTQQTTDILVQSGLVSPDKIITDKRLIEMQAGDLEGKPTFPSWKPDYTEKYHAEGEERVKERVLNFYHSLLAKYPKGNIVIVTHNLPAQIIIEAATHEKVKINPGDAKVIPFRDQNGQVSNMSEPTVKAADDPKFGKILTDSKGMTLYRFTQDNNNTSSCYGQCAALWPPLLLSSGQPILASGIDGNLDTIMRADNTRQVTYNGMPLYRYASDSNPGDKYGQQIDNKWFVVNPTSR